MPSHPVGSHADGPLIRDLQVLCHTRNKLQRGAVCQVCLVNHTRLSAAAGRMAAGAGDALINTLSEGRAQEQGQAGRQAVCVQACECLKAERRSGRKGCMWAWVGRNWAGAHSVARKGRGLIHETRTHPAQHSRPLNARTLRNTSGPLTAPPCATLPTPQRPHPACTLRNSPNPCTPPHAPTCALLRPLLP